MSPAPNFAYALVERRITDQELTLFNLSTWRAAVCGAEPIDVKTLQKFSERFAKCGFRPNNIIPCYGLAEASLCAVMHHPGELFHYECVARSALTREGVALVVAAPGSADATLICDCGSPTDGTHIRITNEAGRELPDGYVGAVWISGPSITSGYYNAPEETARTLQAGWLNTGDLGYTRNGHLFITGRSKDLIVIRGHILFMRKRWFAFFTWPDSHAGRIMSISR